MSGAQCGAGDRTGWAMYGVAVEYASEAGRRPDLTGRAACRVAMARQAGYRRRLTLMADSWRRVVDLFLFTDPDAALAAHACVAAHPACRDAVPALLVSAGRWGEVVLLRRSTAEATGNGRACRRDHLTATESEAVLW